MSAVRKNLLRVTGKPTQKVNRVASSADYTVTVRVRTPVINNIHIIVSVFGLNKIKLADCACFNNLLCLFKSRSKAANLTNHKFAARFIGNSHDFFNVLTGKRKRLFTKHVLACAK